nr:hypothetical protein [Tanacetum cinerariifolium]
MATTDSMYCRGKENGVNILKSIEEGPFQMGTIRKTLTEGTEGAAGYGGAQTRVRFANLGQARQIKCYNCNGIGNIARNCTQPKRPHNSEYFKDKMLLMQAQENGDLALNVDNVFQADDYLVYDKAGPSYDTNVLSEVYDHYHYQDVVCDHHEVHEMHDDLQPNYVVDSHTGYTSDSNMIPYDQYVKDNAVTEHVPAIVHNSEDTLEIAKITRKKINKKMKTPLWTQHKINIRPPDYSKENFLATFTPQKQLTPEQIFWSKDVLEMKTEALKEQAKAAKPVKALTVKCDEIERKNLFIANDTLITNCLSKEVFYIATNSELNVSILSEMHEAHTVVQARCLELETELFKLKDKILKDDHDVMGSQLDYLKHLKESVATLCKIVEEAKVERSLDKSVASACLYTKHSQELLEYVIGTCLKDFNKRDKKQATTPLNRKKKVTFADQCEASNMNTQTHVVQQITQQTNVPVLPSTGVDSCTDTSESKPRSNTNKNKISPAKSVNQKTVEDHSRTNKSQLQKLNRVDSSISSKRTIINSNSDSLCKTCNKCFISANHDMCVIKYLNSVNAPSSAKIVVRKVKQV